MANLRTAQFRVPEGTCRRFGLAVLGVVLLAGCARFDSRPLSASQNADQLESRSLTNAALKEFLEENLHRQFTPWPTVNWNFEMLTLAGLYWQPSLEVARAQWAVARGGETTAGQRPNPVLNVTPTYNVTTLSPSPWLPLGSLDIPIETAGKRGYRMAEAAQLSEAARLKFAAAAWQVRSGVRSSLLDYTAARKREALLQAQLSSQEELVTLLEQQVRAGAIASSESFPFRIALVKTRVDLGDAQRAQTEARTRLAEALGIPVRSLQSLELAFDPAKDLGSAGDLSSAAVRRTALQSRPDVLSALAEYAASQSALQLEIARQYPDLHLAPGYEFDQGDSKWSLGLTVDLPALNQNQGPIAEARAKREEAAARFNALQAKVLAEIDRAEALVQTSMTNLVLLDSLTGVQARRRDSIEAQFKAGAAERLDFLNAQSEFITAELAQLDARTRLEQALSTLEDAVQRPLPLPAAVFQTRQTNAR